jgi:hypothetical protein
MKRRGEPLTLEHYLELAYPPDRPPKPLGAEILAEVPHELKEYK